MLKTITPDSGTQKSPFDVIVRHREDSTEFWSARDLMPLLGYATWRRFDDVIRRARTAAGNALGDETAAQYQFAEVGKMVDIGSGAQREQLDYELTRYAAYLVAMNGDPSKKAIADAQHYFAIKTRESEIEDLAALDAPSMSAPSMPVVGPEVYDVLIALAKQTMALAEYGKHTLELVQGEHREMTELRLQVEEERTPMRLTDYVETEILDPDVIAKSILDNLEERPQKVTEYVEQGERKRAPREPVKHIPNVAAVTYTVGEFVELDHQPGNEKNRRSLGQHAGMVAQAQEIEPYRQTAKGQAEYPLDIWHMAVSRQRLMRGGPVE